MPDRQAELRPLIRALQDAHDLLVGAPVAAAHAERTAVVVAEIRHVLASIAPLEPPAYAPRARRYERELADEQAARADAEGQRDRAAARLDVAERLRHDAEVELGRVEAQRLEARQEIHDRDAFLALATHELKTPLSTLALHVQLLLRAVQQDSSPAQYPAYLVSSLEAAKRQTERLTRLTNSLLDVSRIATSDELKLELGDVDLSALAREVVALLSDEFARAGCAITLRTEPLAVGRWDALRLEQVAINLLSNAIKYAPGAPIEVSVETGDRVARFAVRDHGPGIARKDLERIFRRGGRASTAHVADSLGLGLFIAREIVQAHGGSLRVTSEVGVGSTFAVELPLSAEVDARHGRRAR